MKKKSPAVLPISMTIVTIFATIFINGCSPKLYEKTFDGLTFRTRDTIQLGYSRDTIRLGYYERVTYSHVICYGSLGYIHHAYDEHDEFAFKRYVIWDIDKDFPEEVTKELKTNDGIIAVYEKASSRYLDGPPYTYINVREALNSGEMVLKMNPNASKNPWLTDKIAFLYYNFNKQGTNEAGSLAKEYIYRFQKELYNKGNNDEFEREKVLQTANALLRDEVQKVDFTQKYCIYTTMEFGEYDFAKKGFPIQKETLQSSSLIIANSEGQYQPIGLSFSNLKDFQFVAVPEDEASQLIKRVKSRMDIAGNVSRKVYAIINFEISTSKIGERQLQGKIVDIELYEFPIKVQGLGYNWIGTMK